VASVSARFEAVFGLVDPEPAESRLRQLGDRHDQLVSSLRQQINRLDTRGASRAYADLNSSLDRLLPDFLRSPQPLTRPEIIAGINTLRPSARAEKIDRVLERFLQRVQPLEEALEPAIDGFFASLRNVMALISPLLLKEAVADIYGVIREKVRILDPAELSDSIRRNLYQPLIGPLQAIDPSRIKLRINDAFDHAMEAISSNVKGILDRISLVIDQQLRAIRQEFQALVEQIRETVNATMGRLQNIMNRVEQLVFKELLERLSQVIANLGASFDKEMDRVRRAFDGMVAAIPV
jgi:phage-related protein